MEKKAAPEPPHAGRRAIAIAPSPIEGIGRRNQERQAADQLGVRGLTISFTQAALFPSGEDEIAEDTYQSIRKIAAAIQQIPNPVRLEGHTDAVPIHNSRF